MIAKTELIIGNRYFLISDSPSQKWNDGVCSLIEHNDFRATIYKFNTKSNVNVPISQLYPIIKIIIVKKISLNFKEGDILDSTIHNFLDEPCWYINGYHYDLEYAVSLAEYRENKINEILYEDN